MTFALGVPAGRDRLYAGVGVLVFALAVAAVGCKAQFDLVVSDARCYYVYLPSLVIDGDLDFLAYLVALAVGTLSLADRLLTGLFHTDPSMTALAGVLYWLGSPFLYYTFREPFMAHGPGTFWVTASVFLVWRLLEGLEAGRLGGLPLVLLGFTTSMAVVCRNSNACLLPFHVYLLAAIVRAGQVGRLLRLLPLLPLGLAPLGVQALVWHELYGAYLVQTHAGLGGFHWTDPSGWQTLFSSRHGLFFWSPLLLLAAGGLLWRLRRGLEPLLGCYLVSFGLLWYCNSCRCCWWFGDAFGGRAFLELGGLYVLGLASAFGAVRRAGLAARWAFGGAVAAALAFHFALLGLYILHRIPRNDYLL